MTKTEAIKKIAKILWVTVVLIGAAIAGALMAMQNPKVQTNLTRKVVEKLQRDIDGEITFSSIHIYPFRTIVVRDLLIRDSHPYTDFHGCCKDSLAWAGYISANIFNIRSLLDGDGLHFSSITVIDGGLNLVIEPWGEDTPKPKRDNLSRVFGFQKDKYELVDGEWIVREKEGKDKGSVFDATKFTVDNFHFTLRNHVKDKSYPDGCIDWTDMDVDHIIVKGHRMIFKGGVMGAVADKVSFSEKSGYVCNNVSGSVHVGGGRTVIEDIKINDKWSKISLESLIFSYDYERAWKYFPEQIRIDGRIEKSRLSLLSLGFFVRAVKGMTLMTELEGRIGGYVNDLSFTNLKVKFPETGVDALLNGDIIGLPKSPAMMCDLTTILNFTTEGMERVIKDKSPSSDLGLSEYARDLPLKFSGTLSGSFNKLAVSGTLSSSVGFLTAGVTLSNLSEKDTPLQLSGKLSSKNLDIGRMADISQVHECTMRADFSATLGKHVDLDIDSLFVDRLNILGYDYTGIAAAGEYVARSFNGKLICSDPNLNFLFQGIITPSRNTENAVYKFYANLGYADLHALHIDKREVSKLSMLISANFTKLNGVDMLGEVDVRNLQFQDSRGRHNVGDISLNSHVNDDINRMRLEAGFMDASFVGSGGLGSFIKDLTDRTLHAGLSALSGKTSSSWSGNYYDIDVDMHDSRDVLSFFKSGLYIADSTSITLKISRDGSIDGHLGSQRIASGKKFIKEVSLDVNSMDEVLLARLSADEFNWPPLNTRSNWLTLIVNDNSLGAGISYENSEANKGEFYLTADLSRSEDDSLQIAASVLPSTLTFNSRPWELDEAAITLSGGGATIRGFNISNQRQSIAVDGGWSGVHPDSLSVRIDSMDVAVFNPLIGSGFDLNGILSGRGEVVSLGDGRKTLALGLQVDSTTIAGREAGSIDVSGRWDMEADGFRFSLTNDLSGKSTLTAGGLYLPADKDLSLQMRLDSLDLAYASPLLSSVFSEVGGSLSGEFSAKGPLNALNLSSSDASINEGMLRIAYTAVPYWANGSFSLSSAGLRFSDDGIALRDRYGATGRLTGGIQWDRLKDMNLDVHARMENMEALNTLREDNSSFYGNVFARGRVDITGPLNSIFIDVGVSTAKEGDVHIPLSGVASASQSDLLTFTERVTETWVDPYELMMQTQETEEKAANDLRVRLDLNVNQDTQAYIDMGSGDGNTLNGRGSGEMEIEVRPSKELFTINGNYNINSGNFHFSVLDIVSRDFEIESGSTLRFGGDLMDSELDIHAVYKTRASVATLISDTTSTSSRRQVECGINVYGRLSNPQISFSIDIPDLDPITQARVQSALNTEDKVQKQFLALLVSNGFLPDENSGIVNSSSLLASNVTEVMANQLNNILQKLDIPLDFGLDYDQSSSGSSVFDVAVSTELFNSRVIVNGSIGNRDYGSSSSGSEMVGDIDIEIKLDRSGNLRLTLFSHSADQYTNYLDNSQRNGAGVTYQREFDNFRGFFKSLFKSKKKRDMAERLRQEALRNGEKTRMTISSSAPSEETMN